MVLVEITLLTSKKLVPESFKCIIEKKTETMHVNITKQKNHFFLKGDLKNSNSKKVKKKINNFFKKIIP